MNKRLITAILILSILTRVECTLAFGRCPSVTFQSGFTVSFYTGKWYEYARNKWDYNELGGKCTVVVYTEKSDGSI